MKIRIETILPWCEGVLVIILMTSLIVIPGYLFDGDHEFGADVSGPADFDIFLSENTQYSLWVLDEIGPEEIDISIGKGSFIVLKDSFRLMHPEGDYLPYRPGFSVKEDGIYHLHIEPQGKGMVRIGIRKDTGINLWRYARDASALVEQIRTHV